MEQFQAVVENRTGFCLDPRTKLLLMAVVATAEFLYSHTAFMIAVAMIPFVLLLTNRQYKTATVFFCLFAAGLFVQAIQNSVQFPMIVNMLVVLLVGLVLRLFPAFVMGAYIIKSTTASECITALGRMHIGRQITIPLSVLFRFIPTMQEESAAIKDAMRMREVQFGTKKFWQNPAALIEYRFIPLMISVVKIGDDLSAAALTRGLDNPVRRTNITKVGFTGWDLLAVLIAGAALLSTYFFSPWYADRILYMKHGSIVREFTGTEFQKLSPDELQGMGLRALDPFHLPPEAAPKPAAPKLHIKGFQFSYEKHGPLNVDIPDLTLPQGEIIGIIGNNGAGKSTFARCLCGLDKKAKGVLEMDGTPYDAKQRRHISYMVMQDVNHQLFTEDVLDELLLSMGGEDEKADTARAKEILNSLDLLDKVKLHPMSLSGGEKQRVAIGSAIASDKKILIFDEPTSGLDYRHMLEVSDNLNRLKEMGKSLFLITHDPELIYKCCTYLLFIQGSKVLWHRPMDGEAVKLLRAFFSHEQETGAVNAS